MYSKQQASQIRQEFWTAFGKYTSPIPSAEGDKANWVNYKTGEQHLAFKMEADNKHATISITLSHPDSSIRQLYLEQFLQLKPMLVSALGEEWVFEANTVDEHGRETSRIYTLLPSVNIFNKADWPALISFFKPRIIALDAFWSMARYAFESLR